MTPQDALQLLDNATSQMQLSRADHARIAEAVQTLAMLVPRMPPRPFPIPEPSDNGAVEVVEEH